MKDTTMILNSIASGDNVCASADYQKNRGKILDTGISLYEYMGKHSTHGKSIVIDDDIAVLEELLEKLDKDMEANATNSVKLREIMEQKEKAQADLDEKMDSGFI